MFQKCNKKITINYKLLNSFNIEIYVFKIILFPRHDVYSKQVSPTWSYLCSSNMHTISNEAFYENDAFLNHQF